MGFSGMFRNCQTNFLKKAHLNIEENSRYVLNALLNTTMCRAHTEEGAFLSPEQPAGSHKYPQD